MAQISHDSCAFLGLLLWLREDSSFCVDCTKLASFADPVGKWRKICSVTSNLFLLLWLQKTNSRQTVEFKIEYTFTGYDNTVWITCCAYHTRNLYLIPYGVDTYCAWVVYFAIIGQFLSGYFLFTVCFTIPGTFMTRRCVYLIIYLDTLKITSWILNFCIVTETCSNFLE